jgi:hypothetical protein
LHSPRDVALWFCFWIGNAWFGLQEYDVSFAFFTGLCTAIFLFLLKNPIMECLVGLIEWPAIWFCIWCCF